jgi:hypothetical protein
VEADQLEAMLKWYKRDGDSALPKHKQEQLDLHNKICGCEDLLPLPLPDPDEGVDLPSLQLPDPDEEEDPIPMLPVRHSCDLFCVLITI